MDNNTTQEIVRLSAHADQLLAAGRIEDAAAVKAEVWRMIDAEED
jgi:hypothetical protein